MRLRLYLAEHRSAIEYEKGIKNCLGDAMYRMRSRNHAVVDSNDELPSFPTDCHVEQEMSAYDAMRRKSVANVVGYQPTDTWAYDEADTLDEILLVQNNLLEVAEPLFNE